LKIYDKGVIPAQGEPIISFAQALSPLTAEWFSPAREWQVMKFSSSTRENENDSGNFLTRKNIFYGRIARLSGIFKTKVSIFWKKSMQLVPAHLTLETGEVFKGLMEADQNQICYGEVVFNTGMVGYVESLTDPSYSGQILVFTYPLIGNYGVAEASHWESDAIHVKGVIFSELAEHYSSHSAEKSLLAWLNENNIPFMVGVDTRAVTKRLRDSGVIPGAICHATETPDSFEHFAEIDWVKTVSIKEPRYYGDGAKTIIMVDCGIKENIIRSLLKFPIRIKRVPYNYDYSAEQFDGVFLSNGPGDPAHCTETIAILQKAMQLKKPVFGICLGTQLMARAVGASTYKLPFGHRSHNQPCIDPVTKRCFLTSQNHSYAVDEKTLPADWEVTFRNLNDHSVEGIAHKTLPFFSVQFHPEAAPGPEDTQWLFKKFYESICHDSEKENYAI
jgi:carbamoyl-phosphate synthase small subunit